MVYCAGKLIVYLKSFYKSNRLHFLWVYRRDNPLVYCLNKLYSLSLFMAAYSPQCTVNKQGIGAKRGTTRSLQNIGTTRKEEYINL